MGKVTLQENGREKTTKQATTAKRATEYRGVKVNPQAIDQSHFQKKRKDESQEKIRKLILEAFAFGETNG